MQDCFDLIKVRREARHLKTLKRQLSKFYRLCHKKTSGCSSLQHGEHGGHVHTWSEKKNRDHNQNTSENDNISEDVEANSGEYKEDSETIGKNWARNISKTPLTKPRKKC